MDNEENYSSGGIEIVDRNSLPIIQIYTDENGVCYLREEDYVSLIRSNLPDVSYSYRHGQDRFYALDRHEMNTVLSGNSMNVHMAYQANNNDILSSEMIQNENVNESSDVSSDSSESDSSVDSSVDNPEDVPVSTQSSDVSSDSSTGDSDISEDATENQEEEERVHNSSDLEYIALLQERIQRIQREISALKGKESRDITGHVYNQIKGHELELQFLERMVHAMSPRPELGIIGEGTVSTIDSLRDYNHEKQNQYQQQIEELKALRNDILTARVQRRLDRRIEKMNKKIAKLQNRDIFVGNIQRSIMYPKYLYESRKQSLLLHAEGRVLAYQDRIQDNEAVRSNLDTMYSNPIIRGIHEFACDIKGVYYQNRLGRANEILDEMQNTNSIVAMRGARVTSLSKRYLDQIRQERGEQVHTVAAAV